MVFGFFLRLLVCFVAAKFFLRVIDQDGRLFLAGLTSLLTANLYWFDLVEYRDRIFLRRKLANPSRGAGKVEEADSAMPLADDSGDPGCMAR
jgi:hypothetical protein